MTADEKRRALETVCDTIDAYLELMEEEPETSAPWYQDLVSVVPAMERELTRLGRAGYPRPRRPQHTAPGFVPRAGRR
jgi:hypothetical protein